MNIIIKQPDGQFSLFDFDDHSFVMKNTTVEEIKNRLIRLAIGFIESDVVCFFNDRAKAFSGNHDPFYDVAVELENKFD